MAFLVTTCPHCTLAEAHFIVRSAAHAPQIAQLHPMFVVSLFAICPRCHDPIVAIVRLRDASYSGVNGLFQDSHFSTLTSKLRDALNLPQDVLSAGFPILKVIPDAPKPAIPEFTPPAVAKPLLAAERNYPQAGNEEAAGAMYGRALEIAVKGLVPGERLSLYKRIEQLHAEGRITGDLKDWAHSIRDIRNDAMHEIDDLSRDQLKAIRGFTLTLLNYLFTMPERVRVLREETNTTEEATG